MVQGVVKAAKTNIYSVHPGVAMMRDWVSTLKPKSGRSLDEWIKFIKKSGPAGEEQRRDWLKKEHGLGTNSAWWLAERSVGKGGEDDSPEAYLTSAAEWVELMYAGGKAGLRPIHDRLIELGRSIAKDVKVCPCRTMIPFYRNHVFAQIKPSTKTRIDLGLALAKAKGKLPKRLIDTGGAAKKDRITHRFAITTVEEIDGEVEHWLTAAYELDE